MVERMGRYGKFAACPNFPKCRNTKPLETENKPEDGEPKERIVADSKCPICGKEMVLRKGAYGNFFACEDYPTCKSTLPYIRDTGVPCPKCGKRIAIRQSKSRKTFYSCEDYPKCDFSTWDIPQDRKCPVCGGLVVKKKTKDHYECVNKCGWSEGK